MRRTHKRSTDEADSLIATSTGELAPKPGRKTRRSRLTITGRLVPPGSSPPNPNHPLANLTPAERLDVALEALGNLILRVIEDEKEEAENSKNDTIRDE